MLTLADTVRAKKRQRFDEEKEKLIAEIMQRQQKTVEASGFQPAPKTSHYMYNTTLVRKVVCPLAELILTFISIIVIIIVIIVRR